MITAIAFSDLLKKLKFSPDLKLVSNVYTLEDLLELQAYEAKRPDLNKIYTAIRLTKYLLFHPSSIFTIYNNHRYNLKNFHLPLSQREPIRTCLQKAVIAAAFHPKKLLEIGTYLGWGAAAFKSASPKTQVYSINPYQANWVNDRIEPEDVGCFYKKKHISIHQLWGDSITYNYSKICPFDVSFIDGDHSFAHVLKDLTLTQKMTTRAIIIDDYIPLPSVCPHWTIYGYWTFDVTSAVNYYLKQNPKTFSSAYWIKDSKLCLLIK